MTQFSGKTILVTGGTGSFGKTVVKALSNSGCAEIRVLSRDEEKQDAMRWDTDDQRIRFYIGDVRDRESVDYAMGGANLVFHAAALKQVPSCEFFPIEAVRTNVLGSSNVIESAIANGIEKVVCLGTDKAVYPVNAMGMTKALMEKVVQAAARRQPSGHTVLTSVRYGNVMYSRGSVIPLFVRQIREGKAITVTEPSMTRFMLPLQDAVDLVYYALQHAEQGDVFIKKAPACSIADLVAALQELFGVQGEIQVIGMRHGEKIYETLASAAELRNSEDLGDYYRLRMDSRELNYATYFTEGDPEEVNTVDYHSHNTRQLSVAEVKTLLLSLPEIQQALAASK